MLKVFDDPEMQEIFEGFLIETEELLDALSQDLMEIENSPGDMDLLNRIFRSFHTIKGTSSFMGFNQISEITHQAEDILNKMRRNELDVSQEIIDVLLEVHDWIHILVDKIKDGDNEPVNYEDTMLRLAQALTPELLIDSLEHLDDHIEDEDFGDETDKLTEETTYELSAIDNILSNSEIVSKPGDFTDDELDLIQAAFNEVNKTFRKEVQSKEEPAAEANAGQDHLNKDVKIEVSTAVATDKSIVEDKPVPDTSKTPTAPTPAVQKKNQTAADLLKGKTKQADTIRVDVERLETLMDLSGELVLGRNRLAQINETIQQVVGNKDKVRDLIETTSQIDFVTSEIQSAVMRMRMVPIGKLYQKAPRIVRDLSKEFGKKIRLVVKGEDTEIDRGIIEELNDPLVHMIRNSCDHGIETPKDRVEAGKDPIGVITLDADQEGNNIVLKISDDGKGMDPEAIKGKAIEKGVITPEQAAQMTERDVFQLIFKPGFSTAKTVSAVSGRGVGMDVVRTNIHNLKGMIEIESKINQGSTFIIKLPLTLAIIQGLLVKAGNDTFALPLSSVVEVVAIDTESVKTINRQEVIRIRQEVIPIIRLDKALNCRKNRSELNNRYVVNVGLGMQRVGLVVDELLGQQEIVIKSLGEYLGNIKGIAGSTILGDGSVIMIIDCAQLIQKVYDEKYII